MRAQAAGRAKPNQAKPPAPPPPRTFAAEPAAPAAKPANPDEEKQLQCPLCVEELDQTDLSFEPCPCGYRVCLFCYEKLKLLCSSACPNCRRVYGSEEAAEYAKQVAQQKQVDAEKARTTTGRAGGGAATQVIGATAGLGRPPLAGPAPRPPPGMQQLRRPPEAAASIKRGSLGAADEVPSLPTGATWASPNLSRHQSVEIERPAAGAPAPTAATAAPAPPPVPMDASAWPSLADSSTSAAAPSGAPGFQGHHGGKQRGNAIAAAAASAAATTAASTAPVAVAEEHAPAREAVHTRRTSLIASSSTHLDRAASSTSLEQMSQDPPVTPEQLAYLQQQHQQYQQQALSASASASSWGNLQSAEHSYFGTQAHTAVNGIRRSALVGGLTDSDMQAAAAKPGASSPKDAATQLLAMLKQKDAQEGRARAPFSKPAPPGFGPAPIAPPGVSTAQQPFSALVNGPLTRPPPPGFSPLGVADNPVVPGPSSRCTPIQPPGADMHRIEVLLANGVGGKPQHSGASNSGGTYSLWSGLPGIDLGPSTGLSSIWSTPSTSYGGANGSAFAPAQHHYSTLLSNGYGAAAESNSSFSFAPLTAKPPPPGFGPTAYGGATGLGSAVDDALKGGYRPPYQPIGATANTSYNPLQYATSGMSVYRPQL